MSTRKKKFDLGMIRATIQLAISAADFHHVLKTLVLLMIRIQYGDVQARAVEGLMKWCRALTGYFRE